jgi:hypothetical protein
MSDFFRQIKENYLSIISLFIAIIALFHNARLYEKSEINRNTRTAAFEILMKLGELQQEVNQLHYDPMDKHSLIHAWGFIALIGDLSKLIPDPVPQTAQKLLDVWNQNYKKVKESEESVTAISDAIDATRSAVINVITHLS